MAAQNKDISTASQTLITKIKLRGPAAQACLSLMSLLQCAHFKANQLVWGCSWRCFIIVDWKGGRVMQWWEHSPPTSVAQVQISASTTYVGWVRYWFSLLLQEVFLWALGFPSPQKPTFSNSNLTRKVDKEPLCGCATSKSLHCIYFFILYPFIYLFISLNALHEILHVIFPRSSLCVSLS